MKEQEVEETKLVGHFALTAHKKDVVIVGFTHRVRRHTSVSAVVGLVQVLDEEI